MSRTDYRAKLSADEFASIPVTDEYPIDGYYERLVDGNEKFHGIGHQYPRGYEDPALIEQLTRGQQLLIRLGVFDGQVGNGGITQFFWNYPEYLFDVRDAIEFLGDADVLRNYEQALETLVGKKEDWLALREQHYREGDQPDWETFRQTYDLLDLSWFEDAYFDEKGYNENKEWVRLKRGLAHPFLMRLAEYVRSHRLEFIEE
jgi:Domain of unknown function (DUF4375)